MTGSLTVVGTGIRALTQLTAEADAVIRGSDVVHYVVPDPLTAQMLHWNAKEAHDLADLYHADVERTETYVAMVERIVADVAAGREVCAVFYGHPGVFVDPSHDAIEQVRAMGLRAWMLPGVSAADALYADLGLDPGTDGIAQYTAMDFLLRPRVIDPTTPLLLWQIGAVGVTTGATEAGTEHLDLVVEMLRRQYPADHPVVLYVASGQPTGMARIDVVPLNQLPEADIAREATLLVPSVEIAPLDRDMAARLGYEVSAENERLGRFDIEAVAGRRSAVPVGKGEQLGVAPLETGG
jgi:precorrin-3B methylase